jgi:hypothetical protein
MQLMGGLIAATMLTLTFLPALYASAFKGPAVLPNAIAKANRSSPLTLWRLWCC